MLHHGDYQILGRDETGRPTGRWKEGCHQPIAPIGGKVEWVLCECNQHRGSTIHHPKGCGKSGRNSILYKDVTCKSCRKRLKLD